MTLGRVERRSREGHRRFDAGAADGFCDQEDGVPLYKLARKGIEVEREPRLVHIYNYRFTNTPSRSEISRRLHKGTYVRSLGTSPGKSSGCGAHLTTLRRSASGKFDVADALPLDTILRLTTANWKNV